MYKLVILAALVAVCTAGVLHEALVAPVATKTAVKYDYVAPSAHVSRVDYSYSPLHDYAVPSSHLDVGSPLQYYYYSPLVSPGYVYSYVPAGVEHVAVVKPEAGEEKKTEKAAEEKE